MTAFEENLIKERFKQIDYSIYKNNKFLIRIRIEQNEYDVASIMTFDRWANSVDLTREIPYDDKEIKRHIFDILNSNAEPFT